MWKEFTARSTEEGMRDVKVEDKPLQDGSEFFFDPTIKLMGGKWELGPRAGFERRGRAFVLNQDNVYIFNGYDVQIGDINGDHRLMEGFASIDIQQQAVWADNKGKIKGLIWSKQ